MTRRINLGLQGGGAHGAFTWGVLDRLLEDDSIEIAALSGTSAGALNAAAFKAGMAEGGREGARERLKWVWGKIGAVTDEGLNTWLSMVSPSAPVLAKMIEYSPAYAMLDMVGRMTSPYQVGPLYQNPLEPILADLDFDAICAPEGPELFIAATNVRSGKIRVFTGENVSDKAIMASACLPTVFQAVEIDDPKTGQVEVYWDGGYTGNPALFPFFRTDLPKDIVVININPLHRDSVPYDSQGIINRVNEISFNSSLLRELRAIHFVQRLLDQGQVSDDQMARVYVHMIADDALMNELSVATKMVPTPVVLARLKEAGRAAAGAFLAGDAQKIGKESSVDLVGMFG